MIKRTMAFVVTLSTTAMLLGTAPAAVAQTEVFTDIPVVGTFPGGGTFQGTLDIQRFRGAGGQLVAVGDLTGTLTNSVGTSAFDFPSQHRRPATSCTSSLGRSI